ncbi:MAG: glycosyltransferase family 4 protein [Oscillospiraceae bacterium]|nr:glycosyltransferase family 4 protein [Oscillospiraceae bacterium]
MNFYIFSAQYLPTVGGVERYTNSLALQLVKKGHNVTVVTSAVEGLPADEDENGINIIRLPVISLMNGRFPVLKSSSELRKFKKKFAENKPDFCVIQTRFYTNSIMAARLCAKNKVPAIVIEHGTAHLMNGGLFGVAGNIYEHLVCRYIYHLCPEFYGVSQKCSEWLEHFGIISSGVLYNSVNIEQINRIAPADRTRYTADPNQVLIIFSARLIVEKGIYKLIEAFQGISSEINAKILIVGSGVLYEELKSKETDNILVLGSMKYNDAIRLYKSGDIFCLPTDYPEGFPTTVLESAACKTMVIASDRGGTSEIIKGDSYGVLLKENTVENIQRALLKACNDRCYRKNCAENLYRELINNFTWEKTCNKLISIAENTVGRNI